MMVAPELHPDGLAGHDRGGLETGDDVPHEGARHDRHLPVRVKCRALTGANPNQAR